MAFRQQIETPPELPQVVMLRWDITEPTTTGWHSHPRVQLLYATHGLINVDLEATTWVLPQGHALLIPADTPHITSCNAAMCLCTAYIESVALYGETMRILRVSTLLDASLRALADEPMDYDSGGRGGWLAGLVVDEIKKGPHAPFPLPMPSDRRLRRVCQALLEKPSLKLDIDDWADSIGVSRRTLTRRFRSETQLSFADWRRRLRILSASANQEGNIR